MLYRRGLVSACQNFKKKTLATNIYLLRLKTPQRTYLNLTRILTGEDIKHRYLVLKTNHDTQKNKCSMKTSSLQAQSHNCQEPLSKMIDGLNYLTIIERFKCKEFPRLRTADEDWIRSVDYFGLFGFDSKDFEIDLKVLRQRFHEWQQIVHPDLLNSRKNQTVVEKRDLHNVYEKVEKIRPGEGLSSIINKGYQTLKDDLKRAEYMVELSGIVRLSEENDSFDDKEFLMEVIESREMIEGAESFDEVNNFKNSNKESIDRINEELSKKFKEIKSIEITKDRDHSSPTDEIRIKGLFQDVKTLIIKLRYFKNFDQICKDKLF